MHWLNLGPLYTIILDFIWSKKEKEAEEAWISIQSLKMSFTLFNTLDIEVQTISNE